MKRNAAVGLLLAALLAGPGAAADDDDTPPEAAPPVTWTLGLNLAQPAWHAVAGAAFGVTWIALPLEAQVRLSDHWGLVAGLQYRYEDYWAGSGIWNDYHEIFLTVGPRLSWFGTGLEGWFASLGVGIGYAEDPSPYRCVSFVLQPELGYAFAWGPPGLSLKLGLGLLMNLPLSEEPGLSLTAIGWVSHRFIPLVDVQVGFGG
jgi:hypothetical protein